MKDLYQELGVDKTASPEQIKKAYRKKAMDHHPDRGGDEASFASVALAYRVLSDSEKRKKYDEGESVEKVENLKTERQFAIEIVVHLYLQLVETAGVNLIHDDLMELIRRNIVSMQAALETEIGKMERGVARYEIALKRTRCRIIGQENILTRNLESKVKALKEEISRNVKRKRHGDLAQELLAEYQYEVEARTEPTLEEQIQRTYLNGIFGGGSSAG